MTRETAAKWIPILKAYSEGKTILYRDNASTDNRTFDTDVNNYTIKPEQTLRPWRPEEVPMGAQWRAKDLSCKGIITYIGACNGIGRGLYNLTSTFSEMLSNFEHSLDNGKTWLPCGVLSEDTNE